MTFEAILFDWDNTLVSSQGLIEKALNLTFKSFDKPIMTAQEIQKTSYLSTKDSFALWFLDKKEEAVNFFYEQITSQHLDYIRLELGAFELLQSLYKHNIACALISNKRPDLLKKEVDFLQLSPFFKVVLGSGEAQKDKPEPDPLLKALRLMGQEPSSKILMVGDTPADWIAAKKAGCSAVSVSKYDFEEHRELLKFSSCNDLLTFFALK